MNVGATGTLILGNQLLDPALLGRPNGPVFLCEDYGLCTYVKHHQQKLVLFLASMREYADELRLAGYDVDYEYLNSDPRQTYEKRLTAFIERHQLECLQHFDIEDQFFADRVAALCAALGVRQQIQASPLFLTTHEQFQSFLNEVAQPRMAEFYRRQRRRLGILLDENGKPVGGRWSFDKDNRRQLPRDLELPELRQTAWTQHTKDVIALVTATFSDHWGNASDFWWPVTRQQARDCLDAFVNERLSQFGDYQDAISQRSETQFHSALAPAMNMGLLTPREVVEATLRKAAESDVPLNSLEGFVRQIIGWREFVRGIYHNFDEMQSRTNFWGHHRQLTPSWYDGTTGIAPLDHAIQTAGRLGWTHHISRLMVIGNLMNLCEIKPNRVYQWFMETHVDSSDWVMGPNVYGMALFSDGGVFATKPYVCGSNYLRKMSDFGRGPWCEVVDGLYWRFVKKHQDFFAGNPRLSVMTRALARLSSQRRDTIFSAADQFLNDHTAQPADRN